MSDRYKIHDHTSAYFITITTVGWIDVFARKNHKMCIVDSLKYCQQHKDLELYAWCLMSSHLHAIVGAAEGNKLSGILRDFKKHTSKQIIKQIQEEPESRREWILPLMQNYCAHLKRNQNFKLWQDGNHAEIIYSNQFFDQKLDYIQNNPVENMIVSEPEEYLFSSARYYGELPSLLDVIEETPRSA